VEIAVGAITQEGYANGSGWNTQFRDRAANTALYPAQKIIAFTFSSRLDREPRQVQRGVRIAFVANGWQSSTCESVVVVDFTHAPLLLSELMRFVLRSSRLTLVAAVVTLLTAVPMSALPLLHGLGDDDPCGSSAVQHDATAHRIRAGRAPAGSPHCTICHWWESVGRFRRPSLPSTLTPIIYFGLVAKTPVVEQRSVATANRPARAPPVT